MQIIGFQDENLLKLFPQGGKKIFVMKKRGIVYKSGALFYRNSPMKFS